jgi:hypothetical protein
VSLPFHLSTRPSALRTLFLGIVLALSSGALNAAEPFSIQDVLGAPFPSGLIAAPGKARVAWVLNERGARNIWVADGPEFAGRRLTAVTADDGQDLGELAFTPDGNAIVYTHGGDLEFPGAEGPNPRSTAEGVEQTVNVITIADGKSRKLGDGYAPAMSPRGDRVAFVAKKQLMLVSLSAGAKAEPLIAATGGRDTLRWSPDGTKLAFVAGRREHSLIGVIEVATKSIRYLDPSIDRDVAPVWSPDGRQIAYIRIASTSSNSSSPTTSTTSCSGNTGWRPIRRPASSSIGGWGTNDRTNGKHRVRSTRGGRRVFALGRGMGRLRGRANRADRDRGCGLPHFRVVEDECGAAAFDGESSRAPHQTVLSISTFAERNRSQDLSHGRQRELRKRTISGWRVWSPTFVGSWLTASRKGCPRRTTEALRAAFRR